MKYIQVAFLALLISCSQEKLKEGTFRIDGTVSGMKEGKLYLSNYPAMDTIQVHNAKFTLEGPITTISTRYLTLKPNQQSMDSAVQLYLEPAIMQLHVDVDNFNNSRLTGSSTQDDSYRLTKLYQPIIEKYKKELDYFTAVRKKYDVAAKNKASEEELEAIKEEDNTAREKIEPYYSERDQVTIAFIKENPNSFISLWNMRFYVSKLNYQEANQIFTAFNKSLQESAVGKEIQVEVENLKKGIPGAIAGDFNTVDINGKPIKLADFKGKYVLLDFWASWCVPCRKGNPHMLKLYASYKSKGLEIIGVSDDDSNPDKWRKAVKKDKIGVWRHVLRGLHYNKKTRTFNRDHDISEGYNIHTLPTQILINPAGVVIGRFDELVGTDKDLDKQLAQLFD